MTGAALTLEERRGWPEYVPEGFVPRAPVWPAKSWQRFLLAFSLIGLALPLKCETFRGTVSRLERHSLPDWWIRRHGGARPGGMQASTRYATLWMEEQGDMMLGYASSQALHDTKAGDEISIWVRPWSGSVRWLKNHTRPRRWW